MSLTFILVLLSSAYVAITDGASGTECTASTYGTDFIFGFLDIPHHASSASQRSDPALSVIVTLRTGTYVYITTYATGTASKTPQPVTQQYYVNQIKEFQFNSSFINKYSDKSTGGVIKIRADDPIAVMTVYQTKDYLMASPIFPTNALSTSYVIPSYTHNRLNDLRNQFLVISLNDSTEVTFAGYETGNMVYPVKEEEIFIYERQKDLSGTTASSNNPVAIFSSVVTWQQGLGLQVPPIDKHATHFIIPPLRDIQAIRKYNIRIYASTNNAFVTIHSTYDSDPQYVHVYNKIFYQLTDVNPRTVLEIVSDNPLVVVQIATDANNNTLFMTQIPAVSQFLSSYSTTALDGKHFSHKKRFLITIPFSEASGLLVNRKPLTHDPTKLAEEAPLGNFTVLKIEAASTYVTTITHVNSVPFGLIVIGDWYYQQKLNAYSYPAGMQFTTGCHESSHHTDVSGALVG